MDNTDSVRQSLAIRLSANTHMATSHASAYRITQANSIELARQKLSGGQNRYNLMLLDLLMPGMNGFKFVESLGKVDFNGALIIVSGQSDDVMHATSLVAQLRRFNRLCILPQSGERAALSPMLSKLAKFSVHWSPSHKAPVYGAFAGDSLT